METTRQRNKQQVFTTLSCKFTVTESKRETRASIFRKEQNQRKHGRQDVTAREGRIDSIKERNRRKTS